MNLDLILRIIPFIIIAILIIICVVLNIKYNELKAKTKADAEARNLDIDYVDENTLHRNVYFETHDGEIAWNVICQPTTDREGYINGINPFIRRKDVKTNKFRRVAVAIRFLKDKKLLLPKK